MKDIQKSQIKIKFNLGGQEREVSYLYRKEELPEIIKKYINDEEVLKKFVRETIDKTKAYVETLKEAAPGDFKMKREHIINQLDIIDDCYYNNITSKTASNQLSE